jgi:hypothetical protein
MENKQVQDEPRFSVPNMNEELIKSIYDKCSVRPSGYQQGRTEDGNQNFQFTYDEKEGYTVFLPRNLEAHADNWTMIVALIAAVTLKAKIVSSLKDFEDLGFKASEASYLHGIGAALKQGTKVEYQRVSGSFMQGYYWVTSNFEVVKKNKKWFRNKFISPLVYLTGKTVWNKMPGGDKQRWYNLIQHAASKGDFLDPLDNIVSYPIRKKTFLKETWAFNKGSVFTNNEQKEMTLQLDEQIQSYKDFMSGLGAPTMDYIENFDKREKDVTFGLRAAEAKIKAIGSQRAAIIYSKEMQKQTKNGSYTLEDRLAKLPRHLRVMATNPSGLLPGTVRVPIEPTRTYDTDDYGNMFVAMRLKISKDDHLSKEWIEQNLAILRREHEVDSHDPADEGLAW